MLFPKRLAIVHAIALFALASASPADTITLNNGDKLNGKIGLMTAKEIVFQSPALGEMKIKTDKVAGYTFDGPVRVQPKSGPSLTAAVSGDNKSVTAGPTTYAFGQIRSVNAPASDWSGSLVANFSLARGNTNRFTLGGEGVLVLRRDNDAHNDRTAFGAAYNYGETGGGSAGGASVTDTDNFFVSGKYDRFIADHFYAYAAARLEHDRIADLDYRLGPGVGVGYQWIESPGTNFVTETGVTYIHEQFAGGDTNDTVALRLAYRFDHKLTSSIKVFHTLEYLPAFDDPTDFILNTDLGLRAALTEKFFAQFKVLYKHDSTPAENATDDDLLYTIGVGWEF
jgi:putative salt-induced outer membrane protein YdiY